MLATFLQAAAGLGAGFGNAGIALGAAIAVIGAGMGLGRIGQSAMESIARQFNDSYRRIHGGCLPVGCYCLSFGSLSS